MLGRPYSALLGASLLTFLFVATGCGSVHVIHQTPTGGVVALHGSEESAREKADEYMRSQCIAGYEVVDDLVHVKDHDRTERRITFRCKTGHSASVQSVTVTF